MHFTPNYRRNFIPNQDLQAVYDNPENTELTISGFCELKILQQ